MRLMLLLMLLLLFLQINRVHRFNCRVLKSYTLFHLSQLSSFPASPFARGHGWHIRLYVELTVLPANVAVPTLASCTPISWFRPCFPFWMNHL